MKILTVIGARPQFIKAAAVSRVLAQSEGLQEVIAHTGQHFDSNMSQVFFEELSIPVPRYNLDIHSLGHGAMTGRMLEQLEAILLQEKPQLVLVYGDTNSTLAGALAASKLHIPVAHVEAGLRSFNMQMPEEINRILTDRISSLLFCPTLQAMENLEKEGYNHLAARHFFTGDVMYDAALFYASQARQPLAQLPETFVLATLHRAENTDQITRLQQIMEAFTDIAATTPVVLPLHPRTRNILRQHNMADIPGIIMLEPQPYLEMIWLLQNCHLVMTDSGGLQKEACFFKKPCITLRTETEWVELVHAGVNKVAGVEKNQILSSFNAFTHSRITFPENLYGDGRSAQKIVELIRENC